MSAAMTIIPARSRAKDTVTFEFEEAQFTITGEVDRSAFVHEAHVLLAHMDGPGQDPINCTESFRKSPYYMAKIVEFVSTYDWVSRALAQRFSTWEKI